MATKAPWLLDNGHPMYYEGSGVEMPGYRPGTVEGHIIESDLFQILWFLKGFQNSFNAMDNMPEDSYDDYTWKCEAETHFLYDNLSSHDFPWFTQRIVSGAFGVVDELGWLGFAATFSGEYLHTLAIEADTEWFNIVDRGEWYNSEKKTYKVYRAADDKGNCEWKEESYGW